MEHPIDRLLGIAEVEAATGKHRGTIAKWMLVGRFPAPRYVGERRFWPAGVIAAWLDAEQARPRRRPVQLRNVVPAGEHQP